MGRLANCLSLSSYFFASEFFLCFNTFWQSGMLYVRLKQFFLWKCQAWLDYSNTKTKSIMQYFLCWFNVWDLMCNRLDGGLVTSFLLCKRFLSKAGWGPLFGGCDPPSTSPNTPLDWIAHILHLTWKHFLGTLHCTVPGICGPGDPWAQEKLPREHQSR